jgi:hypothetical protein
MKTGFIKTSFFSVLLASVMIFASCEKDKRTPPDMMLKSGGSYISTDTTLNMDTTFTVGVKVVKTEDELKTLNISHDYDNSGSTVTFKNETLAKSEEDGFEKDYQITTGNQAGKEKWIFTVTDRDGNITSKSITVTVR